MAFIGFAVVGGAWFLFQGGAEPEHATVIDATVTPEADAGSPRPLSTRDSEKARVPRADASTESIAGSSDDVVNGSHEAASQELESSGGDSVSADELPTTRGSAVAHNVAPFSVSASVLRYCERISQLGTANCARHLEIVAQLERESRNPTWASATEEAIASIVDAEPGFRIRALKCAATVCAVEIEGGDMFSRLRFDKIEDRLWLEDLLLGYERNDKSEVLKVTSITFTRDIPSR